MEKMNPWAGLYAPACKPALREHVTKAKTRQQRTAFDIPAGTTSAVTLAVKPRQAAYKAGPGIVVLGSAASRRDAEKRFGMHWSRI